MPVTINSFKCQNGHEFEANAKLRTRCPECGVMTKRSFAQKVEKPEPPPAKEPEPEPQKTEPEPAPEPKKTEPPKPVLIRQGKTRMPAAKKPIPPKQNPLDGSKARVAAGLVKKQTVRTKGVHPTVSKQPKKTARAGQGSTAGREHVRPFWHDVADKYGI